MTDTIAPMIFDCDLPGVLLKYRRSRDLWKMPPVITANQAISSENSEPEPAQTKQSGVAHNKAAPASAAIPPAYISNPHNAGATT